MRSAEPEHGGKISLKKEITARIFKQKKSSTRQCSLLYKIGYEKEITISNQIY